MENILRSGDMAIYNPTFGPAIVTVRPGILIGSCATVMAVKSPVCVQGDEISAMVPGCPYISGGFVTPGVGTLKILSLGADQLSMKTKCGKKPVMLKGTTFQAQFQVMVPAMQPTPGGPVPDPVPLYMGTGTFQTTNMTVQDKG
jgi:hypothetical protein